MLALIRWLVQPFRQLMRGAHLPVLLRLLWVLGSRPRLHAVAGVRCNGFTLDITDGPSFVWQYKDIFVDQIYRFNSTAAHPVIYDCGANVGCSVLYFKTLYPSARIMAFEPDPAVFVCLENNVRRNGLHDVHCHRQAVWIHGDGVLFEQDGADGGSIASAGAAVPSVRLADLLAAETHIDLLKMDIEGAETEVMLDCAPCLDRVSNIFIEYHAWSARPQSLARILELLERQGFRYYLENIVPRSSPLLNHGRSVAMDLQVNIYGYRLQ